MDRRAHAKTTDRREIFLCELPLRLEHRCDGIFWFPEGCAECITDRLEDMAPIRRDRRAHQRIVTAHRVLHRAAIPIPTLRTTLDIGKRERDRSTGDHRRSLVRQGTHGLRSSGNAGRIPLDGLDGEDRDVVAGAFGNDEVVQHLRRIFSV